MQNKIKTLLQETLLRIEKSIDEAEDEKSLDKLRVELFGKKGVFTDMMKSLKDIDPIDRPIIGKLLNDSKVQVEQKIEKSIKDLHKKILLDREEKEVLDLTYDKYNLEQGSLHPITKTQQSIIDFFVRMGYSIEVGKEIETTRNNFDLLNIPKDHPARDTQDTFYLTEEILLRTQTSTTQIATMKKQKPPIYMISFGKVYRADEIDATHSPMFHQLEGFVVDKGINMGHLCATLKSFIHYIFGNGAKVRFRASYFPFTEPSIEVDASCSCKNGCRICKGTGFIEIMGAGLVNKKVLRAGGINTDKYSGFAFGMGIDRISNLIHEISDMRINFENDIRFLSQF